MPPSHQPKELLQPVDTSSQVSTEIAEASLEGIPTSISSIAGTSRSENISPPVDAIELHTNANKALAELLSTKASIDTCRQRAIWELGMELWQKESKAVESIKEAKAACFQANLDAQALLFMTVKEAKAICSGATLEAKAICLETVKEARKTHACSIQENEVVCSMTIRDTKAHKASQAKLLQKEHGNIMWDLERQVIQEEVRSQAKFLSACQAALCTSPIALKNAMVTLYHILLGQTSPSPPFILSQRTTLVEEQLAPATPPTSVPEWSPWPKLWHPSPEPVVSMPLGGTTSKLTPVGPPSSKWWETLPWNRALKSSHAKTFSWDSDLVKEAREAFLSKHSYNFIDNGICDLSKVFQQMAINAKLLGTLTHKIQASWMGLEELKQARALPKGLKFLHAVPPSESPKVMGLMGIHDLDALCHFSGITHCPWCGKEGQNEGTMANHLQTVHYRLGLVCNRCHDCPSIMSDTLCWHGQQDCHPPRGKNPNESASFEYSSGEKKLPQLGIQTRRSRQNGLP